METPTLNPQDYLKTLPQTVQDLVLEGTWESRTGEIAIKYSLNDEQSETLKDDVLQILIGLAAPENFSQMLMDDLKISKLLTGQIIEDLEMRVFEYALKTVQNKEKKNNPIPTQVKKSEVTTPPVALVPEIKPETLPKIVTETPKVPTPVPKTVAQPVSEPQTESKYRPVSSVSFSPSPKKEEENVNEKELPSNASKITYSSKTSEIVQKPVAVPRFVAADIEESEKEAEAPVSPPPPQPLSSPVAQIDDKLTKAASEQKEISSPPVHQYVVDPYREPLN